MERRINKKLEGYVTSFKDSIRNKISELFSVDNSFRAIDGESRGETNNAYPSDLEDKTKINDLLEHVYDYERLVLSKDDLIKRKRIKNSIPINNRCNAKRANGEQCTRRRKDDCEFCGTHVKGTPHGFIQLNSNGEELSERKVEVVAEEIFGIVYYIDNLNNVYRTEDILEGKTNPEVIAKCVRNNNMVSIPELGLI